MRMICRDAINIASIREGDHFGTGGLKIPHVAIGQRLVHRPAALTNLVVDKLKERFRHNRETRHNSYGRKRTSDWRLDYGFVAVLVPSLCRPRDNKTISGSMKMEGVLRIWKQSLEELSRVRMPKDCAEQGKMCYGRNNDGDLAFRLASVP